MDMQKYKEYLNPWRLREGKEKCPCCGRKMRANGKVLSKRLVTLAYIAQKWLRDNDKTKFEVREIFHEHLNISAFYALGYWGIIKKVDSTDYHWYFTDLGNAFLEGDAEVPVKVWVFNNQLVARSKRRVTVDTVVPILERKHQEFKEDYITMRTDEPSDIDELEKAEMKKREKLF